jgi:hypothetical protein
VLYVLLGGSVSLYGGSFAGVVTQVLTQPFAAFVVSCTVAGYILFTDTHFKTYKCVGGGLHGLANVAAAFSMGWVARTWMATVENHCGDRDRSVYVCRRVAAWAYDHGAVLLISLNIFWTA